MSPLNLSASMASTATQANDGVNFLGGGVYINPSTPPFSANSSTPAASPLSEVLSPTTILLVVAVLGAVVLLRR